MSEALLQIERDGLASLLLDVQRDCMAERQRAEKAEAEVERLRVANERLVKFIEMVQERDGDLFNNMTAALAKGGGDEQS